MLKLTIPLSIRGATYHFLCYEYNSVESAIIGYKYKIIVADIFATGNIFERTFNDLYAKLLQELGLVSIAVNLNKQVEKIICEYSPYISSDFYRESRIIYFEAGEWQKLKSNAYLLQKVRAYNRFM